MINANFFKLQIFVSGLIVNVSARLFERQRALAENLRDSLNAKFKIIIFFLIFGAGSRYVNSDETAVSLLFFVLSVITYYLHRVSSSAAHPVLFYKQVSAASSPRDVIKIRSLNNNHLQSEWMESLLERCPSFFKAYKPTLLWGWNGHIQTAVLGKMGRSVNPLLPRVG